MSFVQVLRCVRCSKEFDPKHIIYSCDRCGERLDVIYDYASMKLDTQELHRRSGATTALKYHELLPVFDMTKVPSLGEGHTPLTRCSRLGEKLGVDELYAKDETRNPTGVFKDRASVLAANKALEFNRKILAVASTGNAAASMAAYAAKSGLKCIVMVPASTPIGKVSQSIAYGAEIIQIRGNYDQTYDLTIEACKAFDWYNCNPAMNPFRTEGKKTIAYEMSEQLDWTPPDWVIIPVGNGCNLAGIWKGFKEFHQLGLISKKPRIVGIQPSGANPVVSAFKEKKDTFEKITPRTVAGALAIGNPRNFIKALRSLRESNGVVESVTDDEILAAQSFLASTEGIFAEPGGAAPIAGMIKLLQSGVIRKRDRICCVITGNGLKDPEAPLNWSRKPSVIEPTMEALRNLQPS